MKGFTHLEPYRGIVNQQGYGIGSIFAKFFRAARPLLTSGAKYVAKKAIKTGYNTLNDMMDGVAPSEALKANIKMSGRAIKSDLKRKIQNKLSGRGIKKVKQKRNGHHTKKKKVTRKRHVSRNKVRKRNKVNSVKHKHVQCKGSKNVTCRRKIKNKNNSDLF